MSKFYCTLRIISEIYNRAFILLIAADEEKTIMSDSVSYIKPVPTKPFGQLTIDDVGEWLGQLGLETYTNELKRWGATGSKLLDASQHQIEKELDIKNPLHRKKLLYAIESERCNGSGFLGSEKVRQHCYLFISLRFSVLHYTWFDYLDGRHCSITLVGRHWPSTAQGSLPQCQS